MRVNYGKNQRFAFSDYTDCTQLDLVRGEIRSGQNPIMAGGGAAASPTHYPHSMSMCPPPAHHPSSPGPTCLRAMGLIPGYKPLFLFTQTEFSPIKVMMNCRQLTQLFPPYDHNCRYIWCAVLGVLGCKDSFRGLVSEFTVVQMNI